MRTLRPLYAILVTVILVTMACGSDQGTGDGPSTFDAGALGDAGTKPTDGGGSDGGGDASVQPPPKYGVGGTVAGLLGTGLVLQNNAGDDLAVGALGSFQFATKATAGSAYTVTVKTQPTAPTQTCAVSGAEGTIVNGDVTSVTVNCTTDKFAVGGTVTGLVGTGLVLENNGGDELVVSSNGDVSFSTPVASGAPYAVTVKTQPTTPSQTCTVTNEAGHVDGAKVTNVAINCTTDKFTIGGNISGLVGSGLSLALNGAEALPRSTNGPFTFATPIESAVGYTVAITSQPTNPSQYCSIGGESGTVVAGNVTSVAINCTTNKYLVTGKATGILGSAVLQNNGGDNLIVDANGTFSFAVPIDSNSAYNVTIVAQPGTPSQQCTVSNATGTVVDADITTVALDCVTNEYKVKGNVTGLAGTGLILTNSGGDDLGIIENGPFELHTPVASGKPFLVAVKTHPTALSQTCTVTDGTGTIGAADITNVSVVCVTNRYTVSGSVSGLAGGGLVLRNNGGNDHPVSTDGPFTFSATVESGQGYDVTTFAQPSSPTQTCVVSGGSGTATNGNIVGITVNCSTNAYVVGAAVSGLVGTGLVLQNNGAGNLTVNNDGTFAFAGTSLSGQPYDVSVLTQPTNPSQTCTVTAGSGIVGGADATATVACVTNDFAVSGTVTGLTGTGLVLRNNGGNDLPIGQNGSFTFTTRVLSNQPYAVTVATQPSSPAQSCVVTSGAGTVTNANITTVAVTCTNIYTVGGTLSGLNSGSVVLRNSGGNDLVINANGTFTFTQTRTSGQSYSVTVLSQPQDHICTVSNGSGTVTNANITNVSVTCVLGCVPSGARRAFDTMSADTATGCWNGNPCDNDGYVFEAGNGQSFQSFGEAISCTAPAPTCIAHVGITTYQGSTTICQGAWTVLCDGVSIGTINTVGKACAGNATSNGCRVDFTAKTCTTVRLVAAADNDSTFTCCGFSGPGPDSMVTGVSAW